MLKGNTNMLCTAVAYLLICCNGIFGIVQILPLCDADESFSDFLCV